MSQLEGVVKKTIERIDAEARLKSSACRLRPG
jgi:hypothetical protein